MANPKDIPQEIKTQVEAIVEHFNQRYRSEPTDSQYAVRFRGKHLYLARVALGEQHPICRLTYKGHIDNWEFAIYKYSSERYDPEEWWFPGSGLVDGTIEGAMKAGLEAYSI